MLLANDFKILIENLKKMEICQQDDFQLILEKLYPLKNQDLT